MPRHRTQLLLDQDQYRWLKRRAGGESSISAVVRKLIDEAREAEMGKLGDDSFIRWLLETPPAEGLSDEPTSVENLDEQLYGYGQDEDRGNG